MYIIPFTENKIAFGSDSIDDSDLCTETASMNVDGSFGCRMTLLVPYDMDLKIHIIKCDRTR